MERRLERRKREGLVNEAVAKARRDVVGVGGGGRAGASGGSGGSQSIQDPDTGAMYDICGVSVCGGPDVTGP